MLRPAISPKIQQIRDGRVLGCWLRCPVPARLPGCPLGCTCLNPFEHSFLVNMQSRLAEKRAKAAGKPHSPAKAAAVADSPSSQHERPKASLADFMTPSLARVC